MKVVNIFMYVFARWLIGLLIYSTAFYGRYDLIKAKNVLWDYEISALLIAECKYFVFPFSCCLELVVLVMSVLAQLYFFNVF